MCEIEFKLDIFERNWDFRYPIRLCGCDPVLFDLDELMKEVFCVYEHDVDKCYAGDFSYRYVCRDCGMEWLSSQ